MDSVAQRLSVVGAGTALELRGVTRLFGALAALTDVTITVRPGERRAVLGSNGAGKTTLFNCITGDFLPSSGTIRFFGEDITHFPPYERIRRGLRRTYQISALFPGLTVRDNVYLACRGVSRGRFSPLRPGANDALMHAAEALIEAVHLTPVREQLCPVDFQRRHCRAETAAAALCRIDQPWKPGPSVCHRAPSVGIDDPRGKDCKRLIRFVEPDRCATDAVAVVTGCRFGKHALKFRD